MASKSEHIVKLVLQLKKLNMSDEEIIKSDLGQSLDDTVGNYEHNYNNLQMVNRKVLKQLDEYIEITKKQNEQIETLKRELNEANSSQAANAKIIEDNNATIARLGRISEAKDKGIKQLQDSIKQMQAAYGIGRIAGKPAQQIVIDEMGEYPPEKKQTMREMMRAKEMRQQMAFIISESWSMPDHPITKGEVNVAVDNAKLVVEEIHKRMP